MRSASKPATKIMTAKVGSLLALFLVVTPILPACKTTGAPLQKLAGFFKSEITAVPLPDSKQEATPRALHSSFWTGTGMLVWGGVIDQDSERYDDAGAVYYPSSNRWFPVQRAEKGSRYYHAAVWSGEAMIAWGGIDVGTGAPTASGVRINPDEQGWKEISTKDAPVARSGHSAVWTGDQVLIWGGIDSNGGYLADGGIYNPKSDTWIKLSSVGAPMARAYHSALWTGQVMIVWGGGDADNWLESGAIYDPRTDKWTAINAHGGPTARVSQTAVWTGSQLIVWGGRDTTNNYLADGYSYDLASDSWSRLVRVPKNVRGRELHTAVWTGKEMIIWGGQNDDQILGDGAAYNPTSKTWRHLVSSDKSVARSEHTAVWTGQDMLVFGGKGPDNQLVKTQRGFRIPLDGAASPTPPSHVDEDHLVQIAVPSKGS